MTKQRMQRSFSSLLVLGLLLLGTAVPAAAASGSASLLTKELISGTNAGIEISVKNTTGNNPLQLGSEDIDAVQIFAPSHLIDPTEVTTDGWDSFIDGDVIYLFAREGNEIGGGETEVFSFNAAVARIADDQSDEFFVQVSSNGGMTSSAATGDLTANVRILDLLGADLVRPALAFNGAENQVTSQQDNATIDGTLRNAGSELRTVELTVSNAEGSSTVSANETVAVDVPAGGQVGFSLPVTFGDAGDVTVRVHADSTNSSALPEDTDSITVQTAASFRYSDNSLSPTAVVPGNAASFSLTLDKSGTPQVRLTDASTFSFGSETVTYEAALDAVTEFASGSTSGQAVFAKEIVPDTLDDGDYVPALQAVGYDGNGATVDMPVEVTDTILLDALAPVVDVSLDVGESQVEGAQPAATDGSTLRYSGEVRRSGSEDAALCDTCEVISAQIVELSGSGTEIRRQDATVTNSGGTLSGSDELDYASSTRKIRLEVVVSKGGELLEGTGVSNTEEVDNIVPVLSSAKTHRAESADQVVVTFSERVAASSMSAGDWKVDNNTVTEARMDPSAAGATRVILTLAQRFSNRNVEPSVEYAPLLGTRRVHDRVGLTVADQVIKAIDGIAPALPEYLTVEGLERQDGEFWANTGSPAIVIGNLQGGDTVVLYDDLNGDGIGQSSEQVASAPVPSDSTQVTLEPNLGTTERAVALLVLAKDARSNASDVAGEVLNLDFSPPKVLSAIQDGNQVSVTWDEPIPRGRDFAFDWTVQADQDGTVRSRPVNEVSGSGASRTLTVDSSAYDPSRGDMLEVIYKLRSSDPDDRYEDRATNDVADFAAPVTR